LGGGGGGGGCTSGARAGAGPVCARVGSRGGFRGVGGWVVVEVEAGEAAALGGRVEWVGEEVVDNVGRGEAGKGIAGGGWAAAGRRAAGRCGG